MDEIFYVDNNNQLHNKKQTLKDNIVATLKITNLFIGKIPTNKELDEIDTIIDNDNLIVAIFPIFKYKNETYCFNDTLLSIPEIKDKLNNNLVFIYSIPNDYHGDIIKFRTIIKPINK